MLQNIAFKDTYKHKAKSKRTSFLLKSFCLTAFCSFALATQNPSQNLANSTNNPNSENAAWQQTQQAQDSTSQNLSETLPNTTSQSTMTEQTANENNENKETQQKQDSPNATDTTDKNPSQNPQQDYKKTEAQKLQLESTPKSTTAKRRFIGLEASYAGLKYDEKGTLGSIAPRAESSGGGLKIGILGGYRHFFTQGIGVRGYANIDYFESKSPANLSVGTIQAIHYGINADFLMDFQQIGVFFGLGVGGVHYFGSGVNRLKGEAKTSSSGFGVSQNGVETGLQIGLQSAVCKSVGIELVAKIPFISHYFINKGSEANIISRQITQSYTVGARILYHF